ncbi:chromosome partitioning protein [Methylovorus glucosotrophus]|uniref:ParA family protein n=1 Tax=Methylovorus glucosotrophus TaxID=266009 RepID=UPI0013314BE9|nr:ParA family protein [Methylovorus glucosotrophus]KAF0844767.1 chromosome partitioning protein [Methylovorus glucosotrophus]
MRRIAVFNQKGGVGKTTSVLNLAAAMLSQKQSPLLIDMDPQCHLTEILSDGLPSSQRSLFGFYQNNTPLDELTTPWNDAGLLIPGHRELVKVDSIFGKGPTILNRLRSGLDALEKKINLDCILLDCCPYLGVLSLNAVFAADLIIVPIASDFLSLQGAQKVEKTLKALENVLKRRVPRRYLLTCYDRRRSMTFEVEKLARQYFAHELCQTVISENVAVAESPQAKQDIFSYSPQAKGAHDYMALLQELSKIELSEKLDPAVHVDLTKRSSISS